MKKFTKESTDLIHRKMQEALDRVASEMGVTKIKLGGFKYSDTTFTCSVSAKTGDATEDAYLTSYCINQLLFTKNVIGEKVTLQNQAFTITDINPKKRKQPIVITNAAGKGFICSEEAIHSARPDLNRFRGNASGKKFNF